MHSKHIARPKASTASRATGQTDGEAAKQRKRAKSQTLKEKAKPAERENPRNEKAARQTALANTIKASLHCGDALGQEFHRKGLEFAFAKLVKS